MSTKDPSQNFETNNPSLQLPQIKVRIKSTEKPGKSENQKQPLKLPIISKKNIAALNQNNDNVQQKRNNKIKSTFMMSMENKMNNVLKVLNDRIPHGGYESEDSDQFDLEYKIKKNKQIVRNVNFAKQIKQKSDQNHTNAQQKNLLSPKPLQQLIDQQKRPKSSRDMSNDNVIINFRNKAINQRRPKSSKSSKYSIQGASQQKQIKNKVSQPEISLSQKQRALEKKQNLQLNQQKDLRFMDKQDFANQIKNNMANVLNCINQFLPKSYQNQSLQNIESQNKILSNISALQNQKLPQKQANQAKINQPPKFSKNIFNNDKNIQFKPKGINYRRPRSSKSVKNKSFASQEKQEKNRNEENENYGQQNVLGTENQEQSKQIEQNSKFQIQSQQKMQTPKSIEQKQNLFPNLSQVQKKQSPKIPKMPKKPTNPNNNNNPSKVGESKKEIVFSIKKSNRAISQKKISNQHQNKSVGVGQQEQRKNSFEKNSNNKQRSKNKKIIPNNNNNSITDLISGRNKNVLLNNNFTTQQLKQAKRQLDQKIKQIDNEMRLLHSKEDFNLPNRKENNQIRMRISGRDWKKVNTEGQKIEDSGSTDRFLDNELERIQKLQNRGQHMFQAYLQNRMMLMDLNIYNKQQQVLEQVYIGQGDKNAQP